MFSVSFGQSKKEKSNIEYINKQLKSCNSFNYTFYKEGKSYILSGKYFEVTLVKKQVVTLFDASKNWLIFESVDGTESIKRVDKDDNSIEMTDSYEINYDCKESGTEMADAFNKLLKIKNKK